MPMLLSRFALLPRNVEPVPNRAAVLIRPRAGVPLSRVVCAIVLVEAAPLSRPQQRHRAGASSTLAVSASDAARASSPPHKLARTRATRSIARRDATCLRLPPPCASSPCLHQLNSLVALWHQRLCTRPCDFGHAISGQLALPTQVLAHCQYPSFRTVRGQQGQCYLHAPCPLNFLGGGSG